MGAPILVLDTDKVAHPPTRRHSPGQPALWLFVCPAIPVLNSRFPELNGYPLSGALGFSSLMHAMTRSCENRFFVFIPGSGNGLH